jgi:hypothetical protein
VASRVVRNLFAGMSTRFRRSQPVRDSKPDDDQGTPSLNGELVVKGYLPSGRWWSQ